MAHDPTELENLKRQLLLMTEQVRIQREMVHTMQGANHPDAAKAARTLQAMEITLSALVVRHDVMALGASLAGDAARQEEGPIVEACVTKPS